MRGRKACVCPRPSSRPQDATVAFVLPSQKPMWHQEGLLADLRTTQSTSPYSSTPAASGGVAIARPAGQCQLRSPQWPSVLSSRREGPFVSSLLTSPLDEGLACRPGGPTTPRRRICLAPLSPVLCSMMATSHMWLAQPPECGWCVTEEVNFSFT